MSHRVHLVRCVRNRQPRPVVVADRSVGQRHRLAVGTLDKLGYAAEVDVLSVKLLAPRRYKDPAYLNKIAPQLYGGQIRMTPDLVRDYTANLKTPHWLGYLYQQMAFGGWSSLLWLPVTASADLSTRRQ